MAERLQGFAWLAKKIREGKLEYPLSEMDEKIIRGMANNNLNMTKTAKALFTHRNTVLYHCDKIKKRTGADPRDFYGCYRLLDFICDMEGKTWDGLK